MSGHGPGHEPVFYAVLVVLSHRRSRSTAGGVAGQGPPEAKAWSVSAVRPWLTASERRRIGRGRGGVRAIRAGLTGSVLRSGQRQHQKSG